MAQGDRAWDGFDSFGRGQLGDAVEHGQVQHDGRQPWERSAAGAQPGRALMTVCGTNEAPDSSSAGCGVSYADAVANGWVLKDASGNYVRYPSSYPVLLDVGTTAYQQRFISSVDAALRTHPESTA